MRWLIANGLPFAIVLAVQRLAPRPMGNLAAAFAFAAFVVWVAGAQAYALRDRRWFARTALALVLAMIVAAVVLGVADMLGAERAGIALAHVAAGCVLVLLQKRRIPVVPALAAWVVLPVLLAIAASRGWHAGGGLSLFPGYRELAHFAALVAGYGLATAWSRALPADRDPAGSPAASSRVSPAPAAPDR